MFAWRESSFDHISIDDVLSAFVTVLQNISLLFMMAGLASL